MRPVISSAQMGEIDQLTVERYCVPSLTLMEAAASTTARTVTDQFGGEIAGRRILVLCGRGNNGGDGAATARLLAIEGAKVDVVLFGKVQDTKADARTNFERLHTWNDARAIREEQGASLADFGSISFFQCVSETGWDQLRASLLSVPHDVTIDALLGTGTTRPVEGLLLEGVRYVRGLREMRDSIDGPRLLIVSIDLPSGLNSDSNELIGEAVHADLTVTMTAPKPANVLPPAANYNGELTVADIGSPAELVDAAGSQLFLIEVSDARRWLIQTRYAPNSYKNTHGHALVIAGSRGFTGAAALCGNAAMRAGAGLVTVATPASSQGLVAVQVMPEIMTAELAETDRGTVSDDAIGFVLKLAERADVIAVGPGLSSEDERTRDFVRAVVEQRRTPLVIDADGLNCLAPWPVDLRGSAEFPIVVTPHAGEMLRLMGSDDKTALDDRVAAARQFATSREVIVLLKGTRSIIAAPDGRVFVNPTGNAGLGTAGAGDTLTGIITGFLAQAYGTLKENSDALETVIAALYISGMAGDIAADELGMRTMVASDIREHLSAAICAIDPGGEMPT
ncbi:MAG TPA: NAD(P)H-hydrate dehydratase [Pyrinomonadaceae bacterium]|nr:NAD(P)H-hydrate dehydratase [Pyrinomonadaceae bacterium]